MRQCLPTSPSFRLKPLGLAVLSSLMLVGTTAYAADEDRLRALENQVEQLKQALEKSQQELIAERANKNVSASEAAQISSAVTEPAPTSGATSEQTVFTQVDDDQVVTFDQVIVTARNREEIAQNVPLPVTVLGGDRLNREDIKSIYDLPARISNLRMNQGQQNARKVSPSIRGLGRGGANDSMEQSVGVIVDGVTLYYSGQAWNDYVDLDRIEVLNGPQGTLMGKNTSLGAINIVTKAPSFTKGSSLELFTGGKLNNLSGKFSGTGPLVDGLLAYRANFVVDRSDGIYTNTWQSMGHAKETWHENNKLAGRFQLLWTPSEDLTGRIIFDKARSDERVNTGNTLISNGPTTYADGAVRPDLAIIGGYVPTNSHYATYGYLGRFTQKAAWFHNSDGSVYQPQLKTTNIENSEARPQITNQWGLSSSFDWRIANHTLNPIKLSRFICWMESGDANALFSRGSSFWSGSLNGRRGA